MDEYYYDEPVDERPSFERWLAIGEAVSLVEQEHQRQLTAEAEVRSMAVGWFTDGAERFAAACEAADDDLFDATFGIPEPVPAPVEFGQAR